MSPRFFALFGLGVVGLVVAAARPRVPAVLTIAPPSHDFGSVVVGVGNTFNFTVSRSPGWSPADSLTAMVTGQNTDDFRVPRRAGECIDLTEPRGPSCVLGLDFVPQALGPRNATLVVTDTRGNRGTATLTGTGVFGCRPYLVTCNYANHYSGNLQWTETRTFRTAIGTSSKNGQRIIGVTMNVTNGQAFCDGTYFDSTTTRESGKMIGFSAAHGAINGRALLSVEFVREGGNLVYEVAVACPSAQYTERTTDLISGATSSLQFGANTPEMDGREYRTYKLPASAVGINLSGRVQDTHPDADPVNGVEGTISLTWTLNRVKSVP